MAHYVSVSEPTNVELGDEWFNPSTNKLFKLVANNGVSASWLESIIGRNVDVRTTPGSVSNVILGNTAARANIDGSIRINTETGKLELYYSNIWWGITDTNYITSYPIVGGTTLVEGTDVVHVFLESSTLNVGSAAAGTKANILLVAGGGSGSGYITGGGGAGGMLEFPTTLTAGLYTFIVGGGAAGSGPGADSSALGTTVTGGGSGAGGGPDAIGAPALPSQNGGSGGGGASPVNAGRAAGSGIAGQGNPGSTTTPSTPGGNGSSGAGGGAGGAGGPGPSFIGGAGRISAISPENYGTNSSNLPTPGGARYFAGGGGGSQQPSIPAAGGVGGGGAGKTNGLINTGGGGGGNPWSSPIPTSGGSGIIILKYSKNPAWPNPLT